MMSLVHDDDGDLGGFTCWIVSISGLVIFAAIFAGRMAGADGGSYADWVAALSTAAAFIAASYAGWFGHRALRREERRDQHRDDNERRYQASKVTVWGDFSLDLFHSDGDAHGRLFPSQSIATVRNTSQLPVTDMWVQVYLPSLSAAGTWDLVAEADVGRLLPREVSQQERMVYLLETKQDGTGVTVTDQDGPNFRRCMAEIEKRGAGAVADVSAVFGWSFRDNSFRSWVRVPGEELREGERPIPSQLHLG